MPSVRGQLPGHCDTRPRYPGTRGKPSSGTVAPVTPAAPRSPAPEHHLPSFTDLGVRADLADRLATRGIEAPFPVQVATIPDALAGRDVSGKAPTGSGKTIAFGIPLVSRVPRAKSRRPRALVLVPTRELAAQVHKELELLAGPN